MTDNHRDDSHLDAAIDRAVRDMMRAEPRADLRQRVLAELAGEPARAAWWSRLAFGSAAVAVAVVILLMVVNRRAERPVDETIVGAVPPASVPGNTGPSAELSGAAPPGRVDGPRARTFARRPVVEDRPVQAASIDTVEAIGIEPMTPVERLKPIDPIGIATLGAPLVPESGITPITIERIEITPLSPRR
jgi:hypothetical protein